MITLRGFTEKDLGLFTEWLNNPRVKRWYSPVSAWMEEIENKNGKFGFVHHFIAECDGTPIGFCQYYNYALGGEKWHGDTPIDRTYSIDYLIGNDGFCGKHLAPEMIRALEEMIRTETDAKSIIVRPERDNIISRKTLLASGYRHILPSDIFLKVL